MDIATKLKNESAPIAGITKPAEVYDFNKAGVETAQPVADGERLSFEGLIGELDLAALQTDEPRRVRVTVNYDGEISVNAKSDYWLVAEIDIPAKKYTEKAVAHKFGEPVLSKEKEPQTVQERMEIEKVDVTLWPLPRGGK
jgi:hypothetical protein